MLDTFPGCRVSAEGRSIYYVSSPKTNLLNFESDFTYGHDQWISTMATDHGLLSRCRRPATESKLKSPLNAAVYRVFAGEINSSRRRCASDGSSNLSFTS